MTFESIQSEVATWPENEVRKLQGFLVAMSHQREGRLQRFADKLDDKSPGRWVPLDEVEEKLGLGDQDNA